MHASVLLQDKASIVSPRHVSARKQPQQTESSPASQITSVVGRAKRRRIVSDPDSGSLEKATEIQVKREHELTGLKNAGNDVFQPLAERAPEPGTAMEIEILIPMTVESASAANLMEEGEDSPERAAVESAIGAQEEEGAVSEVAEEQIGGISESKKRPRKTYGKKRQAEEATRTIAARDETPTLDASSNNTGRDAIEGHVIATPQSVRPAANASNSHTPTYSTRTRAGKSTKSEAHSQLARPDYSSPSLNIRQHGKPNLAPGEKSSPAMVKVKEEVRDPADNGRPRIAGGDDEGKSSVACTTHKARADKPDALQMTLCVSDL